VHQHFLDVGAMRLVRRRVEPELDRADNPAVERRCQQNGIVRRNRIRDLAEERKAVTLRVFLRCRPPCRIWLSAV
jgi:hypothetical protein